VSDEPGVVGPPFNPPAYLSPSSMGTFRQCPQKFKFSKIDGIPDRPSEATLLGNFVHEILENFYVLPNEERSIGAAKGLAAQVWTNSGWEERVDGYVKPSEYRMFRWNAWWCIENLWKVENPKSISPLGIEREVKGNLKSAPVRGFIDRYETTDNELICISDYKTGKTPAKSWVADKFIQLRIYAALMLPESPNVGKLKLLYLKDGVSFSYEITPENNEDIANYVEDTYMQVLSACETGDFPYSRSRLCDYCAYKSICPGWKK